MIVKDCPLIGVLSRKALAADWLANLVRVKAPVFIAPFSTLPKSPWLYADDVKELLCMLGFSLPQFVPPCIRHGYDLTSYIGSYIPFLRRRLRNLPDDFEYNILSSIRGLDTVAIAMADWLVQPTADLHFRIEMKNSLLGHAVRGLTMGIETLAYYGIGIELPGIARAHWHKVLNAIRCHGPMSGRDLLRKVTVLDAVKRDQVIAALKEEGFIVEEDNALRAVTLKEFLAWSLQRPGFPQRPTILVWLEPKPTAQGKKRHNPAPKVSL
jgi:hypothetical protein